MSHPPVRLSSWKQHPEDLDFEEPDRWFVGEHCNRYPQDRAIVANDVLQGWRPSTSFITRDTKVLAFGSCFAEYFIKFLSKYGYNRWQLAPERHGLCPEPLLLSLGQTFENVFVIVQQLRWAFGEFTPETALWFTKDKAYFEATEERRNNIRSSFEQVDVFIITLGLSEIWYDKIANEPLWRPIPARLYDPDRHAFRRATVAETIEAFSEFDRLARTFLPGKRIIFTLSPIPLIATFRNQSAITANQASKSILRAAIDEFFSDESKRSREQYYYFPSYELAFHLFDSPFSADNRHIRPEVAAAILDVFTATYTDLPITSGTGTTPDRTLRALQDRIRELENELVAKERVIAELDRAARERLAIIQQFSKSG